MFKSPNEAYEYITDNNLETDVLSAMMTHTMDYSIAEIADGNFKIDKEDNGRKVTFVSKGYKIDVPVTDEEIVTAALNGLYISVFISRKADKYNVHFLVSGYPARMKAMFEDEIAKNVVRYMILSTVVACGLNSEKKIREYIN